MVKPSLIPWASSVDSRNELLKALSRALRQGRHLIEHPGHGGGKKQALKKSMG